MADVIKVRHRREKEKPLGFKLLRKAKKWSELSPEDKDKIMGQIALRMNLVLPES